MADSDYKKGVDYQSMSQEVHGTLMVAKREFLATFLSVRLLIIVIIFTLIVMGSAWGFGSLGAESVGSIFPEEELEDKAFLCSFLLDLDGNDTYDDVLVKSIDHQGEPIPNFGLIATGEGIEGFGLSSTDAQGNIIYRNLTAGQYIFQGGMSNFTSQTLIVITENASESLVCITPILDLGQLSADEAIGVLSGKALPIYAGYIVQIVDPQGEVMPDVPVYANGDLLDSTNENGVVWSVNEPNDEYSLDIEIDGEKTYVGRAVVDIKQEEGPFDMLKDKDPDEVLVIVASFVTFIGSLCAVVMAHDGITRERLGNTMDFLLCRPMSKTSIIMGKFMGITLSLVLPFSIVLIAGSFTIGAISGTNPTPRLVFGFIFLTAVFMAIWILMLLIFSALSRTSGTAILSGIGVWFLYSFIWDLFIFLGASDANSETIVKIDMLNPTRAYLYTLLSEAAKVEGIEGDLDAIGISYGVPHLAMAIWFFALLFIAIMIFRRKTSE